MDKLGTLTFVGKISVCSKSVRVMHQVIGASVVLRTADQNVVGGGVASFTNQAFPVDLTGLEKKTLVAFQILDGYEKSDEATTTIGGKPTPALLTQGAFFTPVYVCGTCVFLTGLFPGSTVDVDSKGEPLGSAQVNEYGCARVDLNRPLAATDVLSAVQSACGVKSGAKIAGPSPLPMPSALPAPTIGTLLVCGQALSVKNVTPGAIVTISRGKANSNITKQLWKFCAPIPEFPLYPIQPLAADDEISIAVDFETCGSGRHRTLHAESKTAVLDMPPGAPQIAPLCAGDKWIPLSGLEKGATVKLTFNSGTVVLGAPEASTKYEVAAGVKTPSVTAQQSLCADIWGALTTQKVGSSTPIKPVPLSPPNKKTPPVPPKPTLKWNDGPGTTSCSYPTEFRVELVEDPVFKQSGFANAKSLPTKVHQLVPPSNLKSGMTYHWHVQAINPQASSEWSVDWIFTVQDTAAPVDSTPDPHDQPGTWWFFKDCCPFYRQTIDISGSNYQDVLMKLVSMNEKSPSCHIYEPGSSKWFPPGKCGDPFPVPPP